MPRFIKDFLDVYQYENDRQFLTFSEDEYKGRHPRLHPSTGKKMVSISKIISRVFGSVALIYFLIIFIRYIIVWA